VVIRAFGRRTGRDAELRERFKEPAWNDQVIRFLDANANDFIPESSLQLCGVVVAFGSAPRALRSGTTGEKENVE